jgi:hypothetical protein
MKTWRTSAIGITLLLLPLGGCNENRSPVAPTAATAPVVQIFAGAIESISGSDTISVSGQRIILNPDATIRAGAMPLTFADLRVGAFSRVTAQADGTTLRGQLVDVLSEVGVAGQRQGIIAGLLRDGSFFQFRIGNQLFRGDEETRVSNGSSTGPTSLADGQTVDVISLQRALYAYPTQVTVQAPPTATGSPSPAPSPSPTPSPSPSPSPSPNPTPTPGPGPSPTPGPTPAPLPGPNEVTVGGVLGPVAGSCPALVFPIGGQVVVTNSATGFVGGSCQSLSAGGSAQATGPVVGNTIIARQVTVY